MLFARSRRTDCAYGITRECGISEPAAEIVAFAVRYRELRFYAFLISVSKGSIYYILIYLYYWLCDSGLHYL